MHAAVDAAPDGRVAGPCADRPGAQQAGPGEYGADIGAAGHPGLHAGTRGTQPAHLQKQDPYALQPRRAGPARDPARGHPGGAADPHGGILRR